jgi:hypothetical protein
MKLIGLITQKAFNESSKGVSSVALALSGLYFKYSKIKSDAISNNKIKVVNGTYDDSYINGQWQDPYEIKTTFIMSAPVQELDKNSVIVYLPPNLWHTNQNSSISNIHIDFGNGTGYKSLNNGASASTSYGAIGTYTWTFRVQLTNNQYLYCRQKVVVNDITTGTTLKNSCPIDTEFITATRSYLGTAGTATLQIVNYANHLSLPKV